MSAIIRRTAGFLAGLFVAYLLALLILSNIHPLFASSSERFRGYSALNLLSRNYYTPGWSGQTMRRFRDMENYRDVDVLFIGSSHCSRSFDPRVFSRLGLKSFLMGSDSQTPLNTYYLLNRYYDQLNPKLVVFELYPTVFEFDGLEGFLDLVVNLPLSEELIEMGTTINHPHAFNTLAARLLSSITEPFGSIRQNEIANETYIDGGYLYAKVIYTGTTFGRVRDVKVLDDQFDYLRKIIDFVKVRGAQIVMVIAPVPRERMAAITNWAEVSSMFAAIADEASVRYYDFNRSMLLDTRVDFRDDDHLNGNGAKKFSYVMSDTLLSMAASSDTLAISSEMSAKAYFERGSVNMKTEQLDQAIIDFDKTLEIDPQHAGAFLQRGIVYSMKGEYEKSIRDYDQALALVPTHALVYYNKARTCEKADRKQEAIEAYKSFLMHASSEYAAYLPAIRQRIVDLGVS